MVKLSKKTTTKSEGSWSKVKIAGNLVTNDGGGLEGLIGLEVLEDYDNNTVAKGYDKKKRGRKNSTDDSDENDGQNGKPKKKKLDTEKVLKKLKKPDNKEDIKSNKKEFKQKSIPGQFVLLKKPESSDDEKDKSVLEEELQINDLVEWKTFGVSEPILKALAEKNFKKPTQIQALTLPAAILGRKDILGAAETGSGKTLAFGIPIINGILEIKSNGKLAKRKPVQQIPQSSSMTVAENINSKKSKKNRKERDNFTPPPEEINNFPQQSDDEGDTNDIEMDLKNPLYALILTPTRELCVQVKDHIVAAAKFTGIKVAAIFGGMAQVKQERVLSKCPEIVVATPGRLWELLLEGNEHLNKLENICYLVIDETDRMLEKGHFDELRLLLDRLNADPIKKAQRQNFVFSATLTLVHELPNYIKGKGKKSKGPQQTPAQKLQLLIGQLGISQPKVVDVTKSSGTATNLTECRIICELEQKDLYLYYFLQQHPGRTIVFCNSIDCVKRLGQLFALLDCQPRPLHAQMNQRQRLKNLEKFTSSPTGLLIATDVAARGLDIPNVKHVIHYQVPRTSENYVHRSGRTARADNQGITIMIMEPAEIRDYVKLCRTLKRTEDLPLFPVSDRHLKSVKARVDMARELDVLDLKTRRTQSEIGWIKKSAQEMDIIVDDISDFSENDLYDSDDGGERYKIRHQVKQKREQLNQLLVKPLFPKGYSYKYPTSSGQLDIPLMDVDDNKTDAVDVMKTAIADYNQSKKRKQKLF